MHFELDGHSLDDDEVVNIMHMFTIAGLDTVTSSLSCIVAWFATHPEFRARVVAEPERLAGAIEEIMRYESPVPSSGARTSLRDTEVNGVPIKQGEMVYLCWASANLDPAFFEHPLDADLDRAENRHIAFAAGIHRCLGSHLARAELRAVDRPAAPADPRVLGDRRRRDPVRVRGGTPGPAPAAELRRARGLSRRWSSDSPRSRSCSVTRCATWSRGRVRRRWPRRGTTTPPRRPSCSACSRSMELFGLPFPEEFGGAGATPDRARDRRRAARPRQPRRGDVLLGHG